MQKKVDDRRSVEWKKKSLLKNVRDWTNMSALELFDAAKDREIFKLVITIFR